MNIKEQEILYTATENLKCLTGIDTDTVKEEFQKNGLEYDAVVDLLVGKKKERFIVEIKNELRANRLPAIRKQQEAVQEWRIR